MVIKREKAGWWFAAAGALGFTLQISAQNYPYGQQPPAAPATPPSPYAAPSQVTTTASPHSPYASQATTVQSPASPYGASAAPPATPSEGSPRPFVRLSEIKRNGGPAAVQQVSAPPTTPTAADAPPMPALKATPGAPPWSAGSSPAARPTPPTSATPAARVQATPVTVPAPAPVAEPTPEPVQLRIPIERLMHYRPRGPGGAPQITAEDHGRLIQTQLMLAWLADPATFPCPLRAAASGSVLEVRGTVPDHGTRAHALGLAERYRGRLTLIDAVNVAPVPGYRRSVTEPQELYHAALAGLAPADRSVHGLRVYTHANGLVTVTGTVASHEEKLFVSQRLQGVRGCTSVDNQIVVGGVPYQGRTYTLVSADGRYLVPDEHAGRPAAAPVVMTRPLPAPTPPAAPVQAVRAEEKHHVAPALPPEPASPAMRALLAGQSPAPVQHAAATAPNKSNSASVVGASAKETSARPAQPGAATTTANRVTTLPPVGSVPSTTAASRPTAVLGTPQVVPAAPPADAEPKTMVEAIKMWRWSGGITGRVKGLFRSEPEPQPIIVTRTTAVPPPTPVATKVEPVKPAVKPVAEPVKTVAKSTTPTVQPALKPAAASPEKKSPASATDPAVAEALGATKRPTPTAAAAKPGTVTAQPVKQTPGVAAKPATTKPAETTTAKAALEPAKLPQAVAKASTPPKTTATEITTAAKAEPVKPAATTQTATTSTVTTPAATTQDSRAFPFGSVTGPVAGTAAPKLTGFGIPLQPLPSVSADSGSKVVTVTTATAKRDEVRVVPPPSPYLPHPATLAPTTIASARPATTTATPAPAPAPTIVSPPSAYKLQQLPPAQVASATPANATANTARLPSAYMVRSPAALAIAPPTASSVVTLEKPPAPGRSQVTSGVVVMAGAEEPPNVIPGVAEAFLEGWLRQRIATACGNDAKDLEVVFKSTAQMAVTVHVKDAIASKRVTSAVLQMPELEPYRVALKVQIVP